MAKGNSKNPGKIQDSFTSSMTKQLEERFGELGVL
jgi:hypothetical protein